ncbi:hypothetical protein A3746_16555 [Oleibacter sp. HI0075]|nr:hypothetical protein A3746_16555 [Oleibacter sp. HI0075]
MIDFMIIGAQKASTSSLQYHLRSHPEIYMPEGESALFEFPEYSMRLWEDFGKRGMVSGLKRPDNLCSIEIIDRISESLPTCKFIVVLREPVSRAISAYFHLARHGHLPADNLDVGMKRCLESYSSGANDMYSSVIENGLYGKYLRVWLQKYDGENFRIYSQDFVNSETQRCLGDICNFLGVNVLDDYSEFSDRVNVGFYSIALTKLYRVGHVLKTKSVEGTFRRIPTKNVFTLNIGRFLVKLAEFLSKYVDAKPSLNSDCMEELKKIYREDEKLLIDILQDKKIVYMG